MKCQLALIVVGVAVTGVVAYVLYKQLHKDENKETSRKEETEPTPDITGTEKAAVTIPDVETDTLLAEKQSAANTVHDRHYEAAFAIKESLETVFNGVEEDNLETDNSEELNKSRKDLEDLLK